jgi:hypothetical protein
MQQWESWFGAISTLKRAGPAFEKTFERTFDLLGTEGIK